MPAKHIKSLRELNERLIAAVRDCEELLERSKRAIGKTPRDHPER